jgi:C_GCAxxG_C_C family probable redox protein
MNKTEYAQSLFEGHLNCAQSVLSAYAPQLEIDLTTLQKIGSNFGGGMGEGEICGAVSAAFMILGLKYGTDQGVETAHKEIGEALFKAYKDRFVEEYGSLHCKDLLGYNIKTPEGNLAANEKGLFKSRCPLFLEGSIKILDQLID